MNEVLLKPATVFDGHCRIAAGTVGEAALAVRKALEAGANGPIHIYDDATGGVIDFDPQGSEDDALDRLARQLRAARREEVSDGDLAAGASGEEPRGRGRPKLGVVAREVTLLPRHWAWLNGQPGGASVALRRLVEEARRASVEKDRVRAAQEAAYRFTSAMAGDLAGFEEAMRALFGRDRRRFTECIAEWPGDVREYAMRLGFGEAAEGAL